jgi:ribosomal-protein-alanine N-acetyltransferase
LGRAEPEAVPGEVRFVARQHRAGSQWANTPSRRVMEKLRMTHETREDFDHRRLPEGHSLRRHVLYRLRSAAFA